MSTSLISPLTFTGVSQFSDDFQTILNRAVQIAQLPVKQLQNRQSDILQEKVLAGNLSSAVANLATSIGNLSAIGTSQALSATSSDLSKVTATVTGTASPGYYSISNITSLAAAASESSLQGYASPDKDAVSANGSLTLTLGGKDYAITLGSGKNNLNGLRDAINSLGAGVTASVLNSGTGTTPYYLSVTAANTGATTLALADNIAGAVYATSDSTPVNASGAVTLSVGGANYSISLASDQNNLNGLRDAINNLGAGITASIVSGASGSQLSLTPDDAGVSVGLTSAVLSSTNQGANTVFKLNGVTITRSGRTVNDLVPGLALTIDGKMDTGTVGVNVTSDTNQLSSALQGLATAYNAVADQVNAQMGPSAGLLSGNSIIYDVRRAMSALVQYDGGSGSVTCLSDLGISLERSGKMSFDSAKLNSLTSSDLKNAFGFLGSATTGLGSLKSKFSQLSDPLTGAIKAQLRQFDAADKRITDQITEMTNRINTMQAGLQAKLQAADSLLASLGSQQNLLTASIQSLNFTSYGYNNIAPSGGGQ